MTTVKGTPPPRQTKPANRESAGTHDLCLQCGKMSHTDKALADQCRLMTALDKEVWLAELDLLTRFGPTYRPIIQSTRPRLTKRVVHHQLGEGGPPSL